MMTTTTEVERYGQRPAHALDVVNPRDAVDGWAAMLAKVVELSDVIAKTEFVPPTLRGKPQAVAAAILAGRELGVGPMTALQQLHVIEGKPSMSALLMRALVQSHGHRIRILELTAARCTLVGGRVGEEDNPPVTYTMQDAATAGLDRKPVWRAYPRAMLLARCTGELCRAVFADVVAGMPYTAEEVDGSGSLSNPDVYVGIEAPQPEPTVVQREQRQPEQPTPTGGRSRPLPDRPSSASASEPDLDEPSLDEPEPTRARPTSSSEDTRQRALARARAERGGTRAARHPDAADQAPARGIEDTPLPEADAEPDDEADEAAASPEQQSKVFALLRELGADDSREHRLRVAQAILARRVQSFKEVTRSEASALIDTLSRCAQATNPAEYLEWLTVEGERHLELVESGEALDDAEVVEFVDAVEDAEPPLDDEPEDER